MRAFRASAAVTLLGLLSTGMSRAEPAGDPPPVKNVFRSSPEVPTPPPDAAPPESSAPPGPGAGTEPNKIKPPRVPKKLLPVHRGRLGLVGTAGPYRGVVGGGAELRLAVPLLPDVFVPIPNSINVELDGGVTIWPGVDGALPFVVALSWRLGLGDLELAPRAGVLTSLLVFCNDDDSDVICRHEYEVPVEFLAGLTASYYVSQSIGFQIGADIHVDERSRVLFSAGMNWLSTP